MVINEKQAKVIFVIRSLFQHPTLRYPVSPAYCLVNSVASFRGSPFGPRPCLGGDPDPGDGAMGGGGAMDFG